MNTLEEEFILSLDSLSNSELKKAIKNGSFTVEDIREWSKRIRGKNEK